MTICEHCGGNKGICDCTQPSINLQAGDLVRIIVENAVGVSTLEAWCQQPDLIQRVSRTESLDGKRYFIVENCKVCSYSCTGHWYRRLDKKPLFMRVGHAVQEM